LHHHPHHAQSDFPPQHHHVHLCLALGKQDHEDSLPLQTGLVQFKGLHQLLLRNYMINKEALKVERS
jgi:hypothetical protein